MKSPIILASALAIAGCAHDPYAIDSNAAATSAAIFMEAIRPEPVYVMPPATHYTPYYAPPARYREIPTPYGTVIGPY